MKELTSRKTKLRQIVSEREYKMLEEKGLLKRYTVRDIKPIRPINIQTPLPQKSHPKKQNK
jgi:hypothetical protein